MRRHFDSRFKTKVAIEAIKGEKTIAQLAMEFGVHSNQVAQWKKRALEEMPSVFSTKKEKSESGGYPQDELLKQIGQLKVENDFLRKKYEQWLGS